MDSFVSDLRYAFRVLFKRPGLTLLAILALAISLGMSTTAFSTLNGIFFKPLPFRDPESLQQIFLRNTKADLSDMPIPYQQYVEMRGARSFSDLMAYFSGTINISGKGTPERYDGTFVSTNFLEVLGHEPAIGRSFSSDATRADGPRELLISHSMWQERFRADPDIAGTRVLANAVEHTIVGVMPEGFAFPGEAQVWMPINETLLEGERKLISHVIVIGRLAPGVAPAAAWAELDSYFQGWASQAVENKEEAELVCEPFGRLRLNRATNSFLVVAMASVIFVLLVSCANVASLLVGRAMSRGREMAIRSAIGATRGRIVRQLLTESLLLSFFGAIGGLLYAAWAVDATMESPIYKLPYWMDCELDWRVFLFVLAITGVTALVSGLVPAWQASKIDLNEMLKDTSHTSTSFRLGRLTRMLAVVQIAFSCALLFGAGLITRNVYHMATIQPGYAEDAILTMRMGLFPADYPHEADRDAFYADLAAKVAKLPGVDAAAVSSWIAQFGNYKEPFLSVHEDGGKPQISYVYAESVSPGYFDTFGLSILEGRGLAASDRADSERVAVVNQTFARTFYGVASPVGQRVTPFMTKDMSDREKAQTWTIVGVVPDVRVSDFTKAGEPEPIIYLPFTQTDSQFMSLMVHADATIIEELKPAIKTVILELDPHLPVYFTKTMGDYIDDQIYPYRVMANFFLTIGLMALFLAAIGVYGMLAFNVSRRRREIGIRMALGANTLRIVSQILRQGFVQVVAGLAIGTGLAYLVGQITRNFMFGINPADPSVYSGVLLTLVGVATLAFFVPARRAARLSPMDALRYE